MIQFNNSNSDETVHPISASTGQKNTNTSASAERIPSSFNGISRDRSSTSRVFLEKRQKDKEFTHELIQQLLTRSTPLRSAYEKSLRCNEALLKNGRWVTSYFFCKRRWCRVCSRKRIATVLRKYLPVLESWKTAQFVTLTLTTCTEEELPSRINEMKQAFESIRDRWRKPATQKLFPSPLVAVRSLEVNKIADRCHPHFHIILPNSLIAEKLVAEWLAYFGNKANEKGQALTPVYNMEGLLKYIVKPLVDFKTSNLQGMDLAALDVIFQALDSHHTVQAYGMSALKPTSRTNAIVA
ncbi:protein rep [Hymenobacter sp. BT188]|uniref:protein rep n=1 Tax=Hymenobacter sp. BT188 TaxID=2763504 RepID=UPI0016512FEF|nr:protein rep [Hymenobacter sp. BT188]MBC6608901.1 protein rep [Hymenobacter sp. BT188]